MLEHRSQGERIRATDYNSIVEQTNAAMQIEGINDIFARIDPLVIQRINKYGNSLFGSYTYAINKLEKVTWDGNTPNIENTNANFNIRFGQVVLLQPLYHEPDTVFEASENKYTMSCSRVDDIQGERYCYQPWDHNVSRRQNASNKNESSSSLNNTYMWGIAAEDIKYGQVGKIYTSGYCYASHFIEDPDIVNDSRTLSLWTTTQPALELSKSLHGDAQIIQLIDIVGIYGFSIILFGHSQKDKVGLLGSVAFSALTVPPFAILTGQATKQQTKSHWAASPEYQYTANLHYRYQHGVL